MWMDEDEGPSTADVGRFIPISELLEWHRKMQQRFPQIFTPDDKLFGNHDRQHTMGTKLLAHFDDDPSKPMRCVVKGSRWNEEHGNKEPMYVILINGELSQIALTSAHEDGGWEIEKKNIASAKNSATTTISSSLSLILISSTIVILLSVCINIKTPISPSPPTSKIPNVMLPSPNENDPLLFAEHLFYNELLAPEDGIQLNNNEEKNSNEWIFGLANGNLVKVDMSTLQMTKFAQTGNNHEECGELFKEEYCGRPLGLLLLPTEDYPIYIKYVPKNKIQNDDVTPFFLVADAYKGLLLVLSNGSIITLVSSINKQDLHLTNALARDKNGKIYISDSSSRFRRNRIMLDVLESQPNGRIVVWDPHTGDSKVLIDELHMPNGIVLVNNDKRLLIASTTRNQIVQLDLTADDAKPQSFSDLPGFPDNIHLSYMKEWKKSILWVGLSSKATIITKIIHSSPQLRKLLAMLPYDMLMKCFKKNGLIVAIDLNTGDIIKSYQDHTGRTPYISGIVFDNDYGYIGSWKNPFLGRIKREDLL